MVTGYEEAISVFHDTATFSSCNSVTGPLVQVPLAPYNNSILRDADDVRTLRSFCRICTAVCGILVDVSGDQVVRVRGDQDHPLSHGYTCAKGRALPQMHLDCSSTSWRHCRSPRHWCSCRDDSRGT
jgi:Molybdopterin oxidoreductase Fe4S4 domain